MKIEPASALHPNPNLNRNLNLLPSNFIQANPSQSKPIQVIKPMKKKTPSGKISRLPHPIREQINVRLRNREPGKPIVAWLNSTSEVKAVLAVQFGGRPISERNLSEWKKRNHPAWLLQQAALDQTAHFLADSRQLAQAGQGALTDHLAAFVASRYALAVRQLEDEVNESEHWRLLRNLCQDVAGLRHGDQEAERLRLERERLQWRLLKTQSQNPRPAHDH